LELVTIKDAPKDFKIALLRALGYDVDKEATHVTQEGKVVMDKYVNMPVRVDNVAILPGSTIVIDDNPVSIASYFEEYGEHN
jgi:regulator of RNase E activity RraA